MPAKPIIEPRERSNSPAIISRHAPMEITPRYAATCIQLAMPSGWNMPEFPAVAAKIRKTSNAPEIAANSGRLSRLPKNELWRTRSSSGGALSTSPAPCGWTARGGRRRSARSRVGGR